MSDDEAKSLQMKSLQMMTDFGKFYSFFWHLLPTEIYSKQ